MSSVAVIVLLDAVGASFTLVTVGSWEIDPVAPLWSVTVTV